jgi:transposase/uncharacterized coiled-coil protein SlyX
VADLGQLSRRELLAVVVAQTELIERQTAQIAEQAARIEELTARVVELERRLGQNSGNSSLPPSSDRFAEPKSQRRKRSDRRPGKQPGSPGAHLQLVADPDEVIDHVPAACVGCGARLAGAEPAGMITRQVHDAPPVEIRVVEHRLHRRACGCGTVTTASAPAGVDGPACYGPNLRAVAVYLVVFQHVPVERAARLIADLCGVAVSTGWVVAQVARTASALAEVEKLIATLITLAAVIGVDETSINVAGDKQWLHVARTDQLTAYHLHESRGRVAVDEFGVLPAFSGTVVHDAMAVYDGPTYATATHALCGAHIIRELTAAAEAHPEAQWPTQARSALADLADLAQHATDRGLHQIPPEQAAEPLRLFHAAVRVGLSEHRRAPGRKQSKTRNLLERLRDREPEILRFATDLAVPFTNNGSERDLRPIKTQLKISGCHRAATGAKNWLRIRGYISTVRKHGDDVLTALRDAITGNPWQPTQPAPT